MLCPLFILPIINSPNINQVYKDLSNSRNNHLLCCTSPTRTTLIECSIIYSLGTIIKFVLRRILSAMPVSFFTCANNICPNIAWEVNAQNSVEMSKCRLCAQYGRLRYIESTTLIFIHTFSTIFFGIFSRNVFSTNEYKFLLCLLVCFQTMA